MVFCFRSGRPTDDAKGILPAPFEFLLVAGARLTRDDWLFAGRSETSRRTITASVTHRGYEKMMANWIYKAPTVDFRPNFDTLTFTGVTKPRNSVDFSAAI